MLATGEYVAYAHWDGLMLGGTVLLPPVAATDNADPEEDLVYTTMHDGTKLPVVRAAGRLTSPQWGSNRFRPLIYTYAP